MKTEKEPVGFPFPYRKCFRATRTVIIREIANRQKEKQRKYIWKEGYT